MSEVLKSALEKFHDNSVELILLTDKELVALEKATIKAIDVLENNIDNLILFNHQLELMQNLTFLQTERLRRKEELESGCPI